MNEKLPYEELLSRQLQDLPLPDEDQAWLEMKKMLDEDDDDGIILPPVNKGCGGWIVLLGLLLLGALWFFIRPEQWLMKKNNDKKQGNEISAMEHKNPEAVRPGPVIEGQLKNKDSNELTRHDDSVRNTSASKNDPDIRIKDENVPGGINGQIKKGTVNSSALKDPEKAKPILVALNSKRKGNSKYLAVKGLAKLENKIATKKAGNKEKENVADNPQVNQHSADTVSHSDTGVNIKINQLPDTVGKKKNPEPVASAAIDSSKQKKQAQQDNPSKSTKFSFGTGIALQQQIPLNGQKAVPYSYSGRKSSLADYIPSVYVRLYSDKKWFLQSEFRYGAPQYTREFVYNQKVTKDTFNTVVTTVSRRVKKTYYHQLPLSFNYYVLPNWSLGSGLLWSKFYGAITEEEIRRKVNSLPNDTLLSKKIIQVKGNTDTSFTKSQFHILFETEYQWKRFSLGLRYTHGIQPYIKYIDPSGVARQEKDHSLQVFLRYELWRSKNK